MPLWPSCRTAPPQLLPWASWFGSWSRARRGEPIEGKCSGKWPTVYGSIICSGPKGASMTKFPLSDTTGPAEGVAWTIRKAHGSYLPFLTAILNVAFGDPRIWCRFCKTLAYANGTTSMGTPWANCPETNIIYKSLARKRWQTFVPRYCTFFLWSATKTNLRGTLL